MRIREVEEVLNDHEREQNRLNEKLKIHEQLIDIKAELKNIKRKNEKGK